MTFSVDVIKKINSPPTRISGFVRLPMQAVLSRVAGAIRSLHQNFDDALFVFLIDGKPTSGKSTFARSLAELLPRCSVLEADAFLMPRHWRDERIRILTEDQNDKGELIVSPEFHSSFWDWAKLRDFIDDACQTAQSLLCGRVESKTIRGTYNRTTGRRDGCERIGIQRGGILLIPGCYLLDQIPLSVFQSSMLMTVASDEGLRRKLMREDSKADLPDASRIGSVGWSWLNIEEPTFEHHAMKTARIADAIVDNSNWARPGIRKFEFNSSADSCNSSIPVAQELPLQMVSTRPGFLS